MPRATTAISASPLVTLWLNSMMVATAGALGGTVPLHNGQWLPHPAPEPLALT